MGGLRRQRLLKLLGGAVIREAHGICVWSLGNAPGMQITLKPPQDLRCLHAFGQSFKVFLSTALLFQLFFGLFRTAFKV